MRVLFWSELFWPQIGGAEIGGLQLISGLRKHGHSIRVVTRQDDPSLPPRDEHQGIPIFRFPFWKAFADRNLAQLLKARQEVAKLKRGFGPDLVHIHSLGPSSLFYLETATTHEAPLLVTLTREDSETVVGLQLLKRILASANWVTAKSTAALSRARQLVPEIAPRSSVVYRGIPRQVIKTKLLSTLYPTILCVGRLSREKGFDLAIQAFSLIREHCPEARMIIAGNGPEKSSLCALAATLGLTQNVEFLGWVIPENITTLMSTATVVMIPSRRECLPRVAVEAALSAKPVIAANVGGMAEVVVHGQTGILVETESPSKLAEAALDLLVDPGKAFAMGEVGRYRALEIFDMDRYINDYQSLYERLTLVKPAQDPS